MKQARCPYCGNEFLCLDEELKVILTGSNELDGYKGNAPLDAHVKRLETDRLKDNRNMDFLLREFS